MTDASPRMPGRVYSRQQVQQRTARRGAVAGAPRALAICVFVAATLLLQSCAQAEQPERRTEHTWRLAEGMQPAPGKLADVAWLVGSWSGEAFGGRFEEVWNPASQGSMVGMFKLLGDEKVAFYELMLLVEENDSLSLKVKHFNADFTAWEDRADYTTFRLIRIEPDAVHFSGLSFYRRSDDVIDGYIVMRDDKGEVKEEKLTYRRD